MTASYTVAELSARVADVLTDAFDGDVWVAGEIRDLSRSAAGHVYFQLVEPPDGPGDRIRASLAVVLFDSNRRAVNAMLRRAGSVRMTDGVQVRIRAALDFYPPQGRLQLRMVGIDPFHTLGALEAERERVLRALADDGLLDRNGTLPYPTAPHVIGVVTSTGSAAHADFLHELDTSGLSWHVVVADTRVQGRQAEVSVAAAIGALASRRVDVVAVVRGGGARTDLATFDSEVIARAIAECPVPVVTGIGHEVDSSVADRVAARSFKTPTACAAALVTASRDALAWADDRWRSIRTAATDRLAVEGDRLRRHASDLAAATQHDLAAGERHLVVAGHRLERETGHALHRSASDLERLASGVLSVGRRQVARHEVELDHQREALATHAVSALDRADRLTAALDARARVLDPARALARGWSITRTADGRVVRRLGDVDPGAEIVTTLADGQLTSVVADVRTDPPAQEHPDG